GMSCGILTRIRYFTLVEARRFDATKPMVSRVRKNNWNELAHLSYGKKTIEHRLKLEKAFNNIRDFLEKKKEMRVCAIGSYFVGASTPFSDLDLVLIPHNLGKEKKSGELNAGSNDAKNKRHLYAVASRLEKSGILQKKPFILSHARIPIVNARTRSGIDFDVQVGNIDTIYSSHLVKLSFQLDPRQILVYHWLRRSIEGYNLFGGKFGMFTSFHLYMLILHFAQATGILPNIMEEYSRLFDTQSNWMELEVNWREEQSRFSPLYSMEDPNSWAPLLVDQLISYYGKVDFTQVEIDAGKGELRERSTNQLLLIDPFFDQNIGVCKVNNGAAIMNAVFTKLMKNRLE
ncbi:hypothetical protein PFISCL1PPCAC_1751, partial [Pristionchus fissidentatus]